MSDRWGRFTARGGEAVERRVRTLVERAVEETTKAVPASEYRALVLIGGFGRGEGGVVEVDGVERPHNNLDFLFIANDKSATRQSDLRARLEGALLPLSREFDIELDISVTSVSKLLHAPSLVIWYDMRYGHKTVLGDATFVPSLDRFRLDRIPAWDMRDLLVNRGTLLVINDELIASGRNDLAARRLITKHIYKAIIGYGDALLFFCGWYDWSYQERQNRMRDLREATSEFRSLYDASMEFRFKPDYERFADREPLAWMDELRPILESVHLFCERKRLKASALTWNRYAAAASLAALVDDAQSPRAWAKKAVYAARSQRSPVALPAAARLGFRATGPRSRMGIVFPVAAYDLQDETIRSVAIQSLSAKTNSIADIRRAYLAAWGKHGDANFGAAMRKWNLALDPAETAI